MRRFISLLLVAPVLAGCPVLDAIEGKSSRSAYEHQQSLITPPAASEPVPVVVQAVVEVPVVPEPVYQAPPPPPCWEEFRIRRCVDGVAVEW